MIFRLGKLPNPESHARHTKSESRATSLSGGNIRQWKEDLLQSSSLLQADRKQPVGLEQKIVIYDEQEHSLAGWDVVLLSSSSMDSLFVPPSGNQ